MSHKHSHLFVFPLTMLSITIAMGYLATIPNTSADDTSLSPVDDEITITVDSACTMGNSAISSMTGINPGETKPISAYQIAAYCNDSNGYDIYAIGYTNGEYGNTNMQTTTGSIIPTGTSGEGSYWNVQLTPGTATGQTTHIPTIVSPFTSTTAIPNDYTKVATYPSTTIPQGEDPTTSGSYFTTTYQVHASTTQPAGFYTGQVQYVMVHPVGAPAPTFMQNTTAIKAILTNEGDTMQAIDKRDGKKYWIAKLADGNIWMTQNLDHDIVAGKTYTSADTDLPEGTTWVPDSSTYHTGDTSWVFTRTQPESYDPGNLYWDGDMASGGTISNRTVADPTMTSGGTHYHIGNYYNWTAAAAMNNTGPYHFFEDVAQSICPAGWSILSGYYLRFASSGVTAGTNGNIHLSPNYFTYSGYWNGNSGGIGYDGNYWTSHVGNYSRAYFFEIENSGALDPEANLSRGNGFSVRCVAR